MSARDAATRQAAVVNAVEVVVDEVALELPLEPRVARIQVAGEGGAPALREDRLVQGLDVPVRLRTSGVDVRDPGAQALERRVEERTLELVAVVGEDALEPPAGGLELARDPAGELRGLLGGRVALPADDELGPGEGGVDVDRAQLPDRALAAAQAPDVETVDADQLARALDLDVLHVGQLLELSNSPHQPLGGRGERGADADEPPAANGLRHALQFELAYELELEAALRQSNPALADIHLARGATDSSRWAMIRRRRGRRSPRARRYRPRARCRNR